MRVCRSILNSNSFHHENIYVHPKINGPLPKWSTVFSAAKITTKNTPNTGNNVSSGWLTLKIDKNGGIGKYNVNLLFKDHGSSSYSTVGNVTIYFSMVMIQVMMYICQIRNTVMNL